MLTKKQYLYTLLAAVIVFGLVFISTYFYMKATSWQVDVAEQTPNVVGEEITASVSKDEVYILPQTKIILKNQNVKNKSVSETKLDSKSLLGLNKEELASRFPDYTINTFNEREVVLSKHIEQTTMNEERQIIYVLGVDEQYVCIKEKGTTKRPVKIDYEITHFSKYIYSLLLNEEIEITSAQKEALLLNPSTLQGILQGYVGE